MACLASSASADEEPRFDIPTGTSLQLIDFIKSTKSQRPVGRSPEAGRKFTMAQQRAIVGAADTILAGEHDSQAGTIALEEKLAALWILITLDDGAALQQAVRISEQLQHDKRPALARRARFFLVWNRLQNLKAANSADFTSHDAISIVSAIEQQMAAVEVDELLITMASALPEQLEVNAPQLALRAARRFSKTLSGRGDSRAQRTAVHLDNVAKRLESFDQVTELDGPLVGGGDLKWNDFRGDFVLVTFWATWCQPCVAELPEFKAAYARFHNRGFKIVGISLDDDVAVLTQFVEAQKIPWPVVFNSDASSGGIHPMAIKYGVESAPKSFLVDREGKVMRHSVHGSQLLRDVELLLDSTVGEK